MWDTTLEPERAKDGDFIEFLFQKVTNLTEAVSKYHGGEWRW